MRASLQFAITALLLHSRLFAVETITIFTPPNPHPLEARAATWLAESIPSAVNAKVQIVTNPNPPETSGTQIHIGPIGQKSQNSPNGPTSPNGSHRLSSSKNRIDLQGDTPISILWAAADLVAHLGIRVTLQSDLPPVTKHDSIPPLNISRTPLVQERVWNGIHAGNHSLASWPEEDLRKTFQQLAKLKFTHIVLPNNPARFSPISVTGDTAGRSAFKGAVFFAPPNGEDYIPAARESARKAGLEIANPAEVKGTIPLGPANQSVLPAFDLAGLETELRTALQKNQKRITFFASLPGDLNASAYFVSRACFERDLTARESFNGFIDPICGDGVSDRLWMGFEHVASAKRLLSTTDQNLGVPSEGFLTRHFESRTKPSPEITRLKALYADAMAEMYRGNTRARGGARSFILYHAKRLDFAMQFVTAVEALANAGDATARKEEDAKAEASDTGLEALYNALNAYGDIARDPSDLAAIATLNEFGYRPLTKTLR